MSRCAQTDALLDAILGGADLSPSGSDHVTACPECARALASTRRFERSLHATGAELVQEPIPPGTVSVAGAERSRRPAVWQRLTVIGGLAAAVGVAVLVGGDVGGTRREDARSGGAVDAETDRWVESARDFVTRTEPDGGQAAGWTPVRVERCGQSGLAFFEATATDGLPLYRWAEGPINTGVPRASGEVRSVNDTRVASVRATLPPCRMVVDVVDAPLREIGGPQELWAVMTGQQVVEGEVRLVGTTLMTDGGHGQGPLGGVEFPTFLVLMDRRTDREHVVERATISVMERGWGMGRFVDLPVERPETQHPMQVFADPGFMDETLFAWIDDPAVRAVDIWIPREGRVLRYTVASPGFVIQLDARVGPVDEMTYELLDADGAILEAGSVAAWSDPERRN